MNPRNTWILTLVAAGLFAFIYFFESRIKPAGPVMVKVLPGFQGKEVTSIQIQPMKQDAIRVERTNDGWQLTKPVVYPAQSVAVNGFLEALEDLSPERRISAQELKNRRNVEEEYGFDAPQATIVIEQGDAQRILKLGNYTAPGDEVFAQVVGMEGVEVINAEFVNKFVPRQANDWRDRTFIALKGLAFDGLTVANRSKSFELRRETTNGLWHIAKDKPMLCRADNPKIQDLLFKLQEARVTRFETDDPKADLDFYGLQPPDLELTFMQGTNRVCAYQFGKSPTNDESQVYARNSQGGIVQVPRELLAPWRADYSEFRDRRLASLSAAPDLIEVEVAGGEKFSVQQQTNGGWRVTGPQNQNYPADAKWTREFIENLARLRVVPYDNKFSVKDVVTKSDLPSYGLAPPASRYILKQSASSNAAAGGTNDTVLAELDFSAPKDTNVFACRGDLPEESSVYAVKEADVQKLPTRWLHLLERRVWSFKPQDILSVAVRAGGAPQKWAHAGPHHWLLAQGITDNYKELAMEEIVGGLGELDAARWVERGDEGRARYGFSESSPAISLEVKNGDKPVTLTLEFGGQSPLGRYAEARMPDGQNWIFEFPADILDQLNYIFKLPGNP